MWARGHRGWVQDKGEGAGPTYESTGQQRGPAPLEDGVDARAYQSYQGEPPNLAAYANGKDGSGQPPRLPHGEVPPSIFFWGWWRDAG